MDKVYPLYCLSKNLGSCSLRQFKPLPLKNLSPKGNCFLEGKLTHVNLVVFSQRECGWDYHFMSSLGKVPISLGHLA